jgi:sugar phosphate isomerase/epimerase
MSAEETGAGGHPCLVGLTEWRLPVNGPEAVRFAAEVGADGVQLDMGGPGRGEWLDAAERIGELREQSEANGVELLAIAANHLNDIGLTHPADSADAVRVQALLGRLFTVAHQLGVPLVFVPSFRRSAINTAEALTRTAEVLSRAAAQAADLGLLLANENVLDPVRARRLVEAVDSAAFRLVLDTYNPVEAGWHAGDLVEELGEHFADQVHLKDGPPAVGRSPLLGTGAAEVFAVVDAISRNGLPVRCLVLENDYRDGDQARLAKDLAWARARADELTR